MIDIKELKDLDSQIKTLQKQLRNKKEHFAIQECPLCIGDIVIKKDYPFRGSQIEIISIVPHKHAFSWCAVGAVLNKDGSKGQRFTEIVSGNYEVFQED